METLQAIALRKSTRDFKQDQIQPETLDTILSAGCCAPVGLKGFDNIHLTVVQDKDILAQISKIAASMLSMDTDPLYGAPTFVIISSKVSNRFDNIQYANASCIAENMMLAATDLGVDSVFLWGSPIAIRGDEELQKKLEIPEGFAPIVAVALGYARQKDDSVKDLDITIGLNRI